MKMILPLALVISLVFVGTSATISLELGKDKTTIEKKIYVVQFMASSKPDKNFPQLSTLGEISVEQSTSGKIFKYRIGYYSDLDTVQFVIEKLEELGFKEAFLVVVQN